MDETFGTFVSKSLTYSSSAVTDLFPSTEDGHRYVINYYGIDNGEFTVHSANPYLPLVKGWDKWGKIGDRVILVSLDIDASGSVYSQTSALKAAIVNSVKALTSDKYAFTQATWLRVTTFNSYGIRTIIDWTPLDAIDVNGIDDIDANGGTPLSSAELLSLNSARNMAAAVKAHTDLKVIVCKLNVGDGRENGNQPFGPEDVKEYGEQAEFVDPAGTKPLIHKLHRSMLYIGDTTDLAACQDYATRSGAAFDAVSDPNQRRMTNWYVDRVHTASALGEEEEDGTDTEGVTDFAAQAAASDVDDVFTDNDED